MGSGGKEAGIIEDVIEGIRKAIRRPDEVLVERVCLGLGYTGVKLVTGHAGICNTPQWELACHSCSVVGRAGTLAGSNALELADLARSWDLSLRTVGVAVLNALSQ